jgi:hypothetical protein
MSKKIKTIPLMFLIGVLAGCSKDPEIAPLGANFEKPDSALMRKAQEPRDLPKGAGLGVCTVEYAELRRLNADTSDRFTLLQRWASRLTGAKQQSVPKKGAATSAPTS